VDLPGDIIGACGLFAFIGPEPHKYFSWDKFTILGLFNDSRGGDACGRVVGNIVQHGTGTLETYKKFSSEISPVKLKTYPHVILGHCRKASSGGRNEIYAQPIVLKKKDVNMKSIKDTHLKKIIKTLDDDTIIYSGIHNGTIENYKELAPMYGIPIEDHNDSKVLLTALFYNNFDILSKYIGTAAIIWQNHITGKSFVFRGASKVASYSVKSSEERPLFYYDMGKGNFYLSSIDDALRSLGASEKRVKEVKFNTIIILKDGIRIKEIIINRNEVTQGKYDWSTSTKKSKYYRDNYYMGDHVEEDVVYERNRDKKNQLVLPGWNFGGNNNTLPKIGADTTSPFVRQFDNYSEPFRLQAEICDSHNSIVIRKATFNKGRYWMNGGLMHGIYILNGMGVIPSRLTMDSSILKPYYFIEGILLDGITGYNKVLEIHKKFITAITSNIALLTTDEQRFTEDIVKYSRYPTVSLTRTMGEQDCFDSMVAYNDEDANNFYDGTFNPLFSDKDYTFKNGNLISIRMAKGNIRIASHDEKDSEITKAYFDICRQDFTKDDDYKKGLQLMYMPGAKNCLSPFQNALFAFADLNGEVELTLLCVHYLRDFCNDVKTACGLCSTRNSKLLSLCAVCRDCKTELSKLTTDVDYAIFK